MNRWTRIDSRIWSDAGFRQLTERRALVKSLEASTRVGYEHKSKTWRLREVKT